MSTLIVALLSAVGFIVAYNTYGRWLGRRIFQLDPDANVPSKELQDDVDFIPTRRSVIFGHHFTSIAGTGPIVGPAIAVFWGWLPALLWVILGSILIGAVHDFSALVISLRNRGQTVGEIAGRVIFQESSCPLSADPVFRVNHGARHFWTRDCDHLQALSEFSFGRLDLAAHRDWNWCLES